MSTTVRGFEHALWESFGLADFGDFSDKISECNQRELADCTAGNWFYIPDEPVVSEQGTHRVIYHGSWGNYNSPGASDYTYAELFDVNDEGDMEEFEQQREQWENAPEWMETDDDEEDEEDDDEYDDYPEEGVSGWADPYMGPN